MDINFKVCVRCFTFNQAGYIEDALNGFCMQQTNFPFVCCIMDDCSTDGEQEVIMHYLQEHFNFADKEVEHQEETNDYITIFTQHKENKNCFLAVYLLKYNHYEKKSKLQYIAQWEERAKYIAMCEGDDYWIHPKKLQLQADYLDTHDEISLACTRYNVLVQETGEISLYPDYYFDSKDNQGEEVHVFDRKEAFLRGWITKYLTCMYKKDDFNKSFYNKFRYRRDVHSVYQLLSKKNGVCFFFIGGVYRKNRGSTFGGKSEKEQRKQNFLVYKELYEKTDDPLIYKILSKSEYLENHIPVDFLEIKLFASHLIMRVKRKLRKSN